MHPFEKYDVTIGDDVVVAYATGDGSVSKSTKPCKQMETFKKGDRVSIWGNPDRSGIVTRVGDTIARILWDDCVLKAEFVKNLRKTTLPY